MVSVVMISGVGWIITSLAVLLCILGLIIILKSDMHE